MLRLFFSIFVLLTLGHFVQAGVYYSGEQYAELPSQWRGFLLDQRTLRNIGIKPSSQRPAGPVRKKYEDTAAKIEKISRERKLTADEAADLGALYVRLGEPGKAVEFLRAAQRVHSNHFRLAANLGTAWQLQGDLEQAVVYLELAVRLAPGKVQKAEKYHLKLVRLRSHPLTPAPLPRGGRGEEGRPLLPLPRGEKAEGLDDLFGVQFVDDDGKYHPGRLAAGERKKLLADAVAIVQQLALWLPADGP